MDTNKLNKWADLLLDTGKRNNLINFKDSKLGAVEVVLPDFYTLFSKAEHSACFEVYDPKLDDEEDELEQFFENEPLLSDVEPPKKYLSKQEYIDKYQSRLKKNGQILIYNAYENPIKALRNIGKRAKTAIEETGVNIAYMAFGFIHWFEEDLPEHVYRAPILLAPISIESESAVDPYNIKIMDSDIIVNPTFSFKLKNDYGIELPLYEEESVDEYFAKVFELVSKLKWTISTECKIGVFSFLKINMHKDLKDNAVKILQNKGVRALLGEEDINSSPLTDNNNSVLLHNVLDADSSQTEAIEMARSGKSFVLQGPPGTGKSQTITNIIAECLADGKKVLFVSEKLAALSVVYDKLKNAGLEEFCLELHSHKANKKDVIEELCHTLKLKKSGLSNRAEKELELKQRAQKELDDYTEELHKIRPTINKTLYNLYDEVSACRKSPYVDFVISDIKSKSDEYINQAEVLLARYVEYVKSIGVDYKQNVWYGFSDFDYSYQSATQLKINLKSVISLLDVIKLLNEALKQNCGVSCKNLSQAYVLKDFLNLVKESKFITPALFNSYTLANALKTVISMREMAKEILSVKDTIDKTFDEDVYNLDGKTIYKKLTKKYNTFFARLFSSEYRQIASDIKFSSINGKKLKYYFAVKMMNTLRIYQDKLGEFKKLEDKVKTQLGANYNGVLTDFNSLITELEALTKFFATGIDFSVLKNLSNGDFIVKQKDFINYSNTLNQAFDSFEETEKGIRDKFNVKQFDVLNVSIDCLYNKYQACIENIDNLDNWCQFNKLLNSLIGLDLKVFVDYSIKHKIKPQSLVLAYKKAFYMQWIDAVLHESNLLVNLSRIPHDEAVKLFKDKDQLNFEINKAKIKAKLSALRPDLDMVAQGSAIALLLREGEKKRKQKGVRALLEEIGELVQSLKPCFLMSPLSVSTFLSADIKFDVVVFDEASQIFPQDAVGAIYRGKQLIVVGDSKQMPPSNFFNSTANLEDSDDEQDDVTDFESILDICSTAFPQKRLKWHYRSRFEPLIAFSNKNFYDNDLVTFPSSKKDTKGIGVDYYHVDGVFDRKTKTNRIEAEKIVDLVFEHIEKYPERSLGVVAFSISQQNLIDKLITKRRLLNPTKEYFFKADKFEPFFVKNLETVQGDERDTIIFSVAYGKGVDGRLLLNFGPINRSGGERRLNVAVTRAKYNVQLVSSMHYTDIDLTRTQSVGARLLREYLDYAENGEVALERLEKLNAFEENVSEFESEVYDFLVENGFSVERQVGCSSFKIALAVKNPKTNDYLLAIECDGQSYRSSKSARDRDRLRQEILEKMGWKFYRIWSTDWFRNKSVEKERLLLVAKLALETASFKFKKDKMPISGVSFEEAVQEKSFEFPKYQMVDEYNLADKHDFDRLKIISEIVETEQPISEEWLLKRIAFLFGREKVTNVVRDEFNYQMRKCQDFGIIRKNGFMYIEGKSVPMLRVPSENATVIRDVKYIALEELALGMKEILLHNVSVEKGGLFRLLVQQLGFTRIGEAILDRLEDALRLISNEIEINGDIISLKNN